MAIRRISGNILQDNLQRGANLTIQGNLVYIDIVNQRLGVATSSTTHKLTVSGNGKIDGLSFSGNAITADSGILEVGSNANIRITGGSSGYVLTTNGAGNLSWSDSSTFSNISVGNIQVTSLTSNRVVFVGTNDYLVDDANLTFDGANLVLLGRANIDNVTIDGTVISSNANISITATSGNLRFTPGSSGVTQINSTTALTMPTGNTAQRPASPDQGAVRFNTTGLALEIYNGTSWELVGQDLTILTSQTINGDGTNVAFGLNESSTSGGVLVSINGVIQIPDVSYGVSSNVITFTEAPQVSDAVEVRFLTQITTVTEITNTSGNAIVAVSANASQVDITGNLLPTANVTYDLGNSSMRWRHGYFSGNSITLGNVVLKNTSGNVLALFGPDGSTPGTLSGGGADLAEYYITDQLYDQGTVLIFGGQYEVTQSTTYADQSLAGIVSTNPAFVMNAGQPNSIPIVLAGKVSCWVVGPVSKGDVLTTSAVAGHAEKLQNTAWLPGVIVGKALESAPVGRHKIMVVVSAG